MTGQICDTHRLGMVDYQVAWQLQKQLAAARGRDALTDQLLLLEHPHTYTLGSAGCLDHLLMDEAERAARGVAVYHVDRGGDITYHGPGQLVGYPILRLAVGPGTLRTGVVDYIRQLEAVLIQALATFGVTGQRLPGYTGVWVNWDGVLHKIAAIGVKVTARGVTMHGFALNVNPDMAYFAGIIPCGIDGKPVISLAQVYDGPLAMEQVMDAVETAFGDVLARSLRPGDPALLNALTAQP